MGVAPKTRPNSQAERAAVGQGFSLCFIYHYGPGLSQLKARSHQCTLKQEEMPLCQGQVEPSPCSLPSPHCSSPLPSRCWPPTVGFDSEAGFGTSPLLAGEMAIKAQACFLFRSAAGLERWKVIYAEKELYKENDATNAVPTKIGMGKGREFTAHRPVK